MPRGRRPKATNAHTCECGATVFAYTSLFWIAIVDVEDGWLLRDYKWHATGKSLEKPFYAQSVRYSRKTGNSNLLHQAVTKYTHPQWDHINHNGHDDRKANLRACSNSQNTRHRKKHSLSTSQYKGVSRHGDKWSARIVLMKWCG
jgi:hypothetical protein